MNDIAKFILSAKRRRLLRSKPVYQQCARVTEEDLFKIARTLNCKLIPGLCKWLLLAGYGDIDETLSFRKNNFFVIDGGALTGYVSFAQDNLGIVYAFNPKDGGIYYVNRKEHVYGHMADNFSAFLRELSRRNYDLPAWRDSLPVETYEAAVNKN